MKKKGFTLIQLLVAFAVIAILSTIVIASGSKSRAKARDTRRVSDVAQIQVALEGYYDQGTTTVAGVRKVYPNSLNALVSERFLPVLPKDPQGATYQYHLLSNTSYCLGINLEAASSVLQNSSTTCGTYLTGLTAERRYMVAP